jgi:hypothetical protein
LDSAIENIQRWKDRPEEEEEDSNSSTLMEDTEFKFELSFPCDEIQSRCADDKKVPPSPPCLGTQFPQMTSLDQLIHSPRYEDTSADQLEEKRRLSENLVRLRRLEAEVRSDDLLGSQEAQSKVCLSLSLSLCLSVTFRLSVTCSQVRAEGIELEQDVGDLEMRLRRYNDELDRFLAFDSPSGPNE